MNPTSKRIARAVARVELTQRALLGDLDDLESLELEGLRVGALTDRAARAADQAATIASLIVTSSEAVSA